MKINKLKYWAFAAMLGLGCVSCEDFLDKPTEDNYNVDNFYENDEQCLQGVNYLYNSPWYDYLRGFIRVGEVLSGNIYCGGEPYMNFSVNGTDVNLVSMSYSLWAVNGHCNTVITNIRKSSGPSENVKNQCIGEALTWKAFAYFFLVRTFGAVPIVHDNNAELTSGSYNEKYKVEAADVYEYIVMTLEKAMELLPKKTSNYDGRLDYYAAEALLAKVYLTKSGVSGTRNAEDLAKAAQYAKDVIDHSGRHLLTNYSDLFRLQNNVNEECLISWLWSSAREPWTQQNSFQCELAMTGFDEFGDCWGGYTSPSVDLMDAFEANPLTKPSDRIDVDTRRKATMMMPGDVYEYFWTDKGGFDYLRFIYDSDDYGKGGPGGTLQSPTGSNCVKHLYGNNYDHVQALGVSAGNMYNGLATHLLRLADVYLIFAEAKMGLSSSTTDAEAVEAFNVVHSRAVPTATPKTSVTWEDIWKERRLELACEGDRWYDFVRLAYYDPSRAISELKSQRRNAFWNLDDAYKKYYESGYQTWDTSAAQYDTDTEAPNVVASSFTLPFPTEDVVFNPHLMEDPIHVDVRAEYSYDF